MPEEKLAPLCRLLPVGVESMRALLTAATELGLTAEDRQDIFADNARRLLGLLPESGTLTQELYRHAKERMPGGVQLLSKRPEMLAPEQWPAYFREARGCEVWDLDGRHYYDLSTNGIGACLLGFRDPDVTAAVQRRISLGSMCTLNAPEEVELADLLCAIHPWAEQVRFARGGGEACAVAVRIARATTDRSVVAICGYHGCQDWYLAANLGESDALRGHLLPGLSPIGVPRRAARHRLHLRLSRPRGVPDAAGGARRSAGGPSSWSPCARKTPSPASSRKCATARIAAARCSSSMKSASAGACISAART